MHNGLQMIKGWWTRLCACARICTRSSTKEQERLNNVHKGHIQIKVSQLKGSVQIPDKFHFYETEKNAFKDFTHKM